MPALKRASAPGTRYGRVSLRANTRARAAVLLGSLACAAVAGCQSRPPVFLLTVDTLRADHTTVYGYERDTTPALAVFAADAVTFTRAFTPRPKTTPAYASMLTGLYPHHHGVRELGQALAPANVTLAERLRAADYRTGAFVSSTVMIDRLSDLGQGFHVWDDHMPAREANRENFERRAEQTVSSALVWIAKWPQRPFVLLHLIDPHGPYTAPRTFGPRFEAGTGSAMDALSEDLIPRFQRLDGATSLAAYVAAYDTEIAYTDRELGRLFESLRTLGLYDEALIIVTADHGEGLGENGEYFHHGDQLHEPTTHVPLLVKPPGGRARGAPTVWPEAVSLVDIVPTVLDYAGLQIPSSLDGASLRGIVEGRSPGRDAKGRVVFSEKPGDGPRIAAHDRSGTLVTGSACVEGEACFMAYYPAGTAVAANADPNLERLLVALGAHSRQAGAHVLPFEVARRYDPADKRFVKHFVSAHNKTLVAMQRSYPLTLSARELEALRKLGYVE